MLYLPAGVQLAALGLSLCLSSTMGLWSLFLIVSLGVLMLASDIGFAIYLLDAFWFLGC